ncbi:MAG: hypothetical protein ACLP01_25990 [Solirubrobacteraceae bacterium]
MEQQPATLATRLIMNITLSREGRYEGEIRSGTDTVPFSGTLELLKVLEELVVHPAATSMTAHTDSGHDSGSIR